METINSSAEKRINAFLERHKTEVDELAEKSSNPETKLNALYDYLQRVDMAVEVRKEALESARRELKSNAINVQNIAQTSEIARKTFYNNPLLAEYVKECAEEDSGTNALDEANAMIGRLRDDIKEMKSEMNKALAHVADSEDLLIENKKLTEEIKNMQTIIQGLTERLEELAKQLDEARSQNPSKLLSFGNNSDG